MRSSGILMHISSLPSPYGIGTLGKEAYDFVDFLHAAGQKYWQVLPIGPTGCGDSPYQSFSAFAGNPYFIDLDILVGSGLLTREAVNSVNWGDDPSKVDYGAMYYNRFNILRQAYSVFTRHIPGDYYKFLDENKLWLPDYALFMALKNENGGKSWQEWGDVRFYEDPAVEESRIRLREEIDFYYFLQYEFFSQWSRLIEYAHMKGVRMICDVPIYVPLDSVDVWSKPELFVLDEKRRPKEVAGVPPDYFTVDGQLWGNPIYMWEEHEKDGFSWWTERLRAAGRLCDAIRLDHFRGFASYWSVPYGNDTAREGKWVEGPGTKFVDAIRSIEGIEYIAEDLGVLTADVMELLDYSGFPGMKVLQFAFDPWANSVYLPHNYERNCVCYTGTHDNSTLKQWLDETNESVLEFAEGYLGLSRGEGYLKGVIRGGMSSVADLFMAQMQDYLNVGAEGRMNMPGSLNGTNWRWRAHEGEINGDLAARIREMTQRYGRL